MCWLLWCLLFIWLPTHSSQTSGVLRPTTGGLSCSKEHGPCHIPLLAFVPCLNDSADVGGASSRCDVFMYPAILQAVEDVNSNGSVLRNGRRERLDFRLNLTYVVTEENSYETLFSFFTTHHVQGGNLTGMVGPSNNVVTELMAYIFGEKLPAVTVSYGATDILFSNRTSRYSHLYRTLASEEALNQARVCLLRRLDWKRIAIATSTTDHSHTRAAENLAMLSNQSTIKVTLHQIEGLSMDASLVFREWQLSHTRIIVGLFRPLEARRVLCQAYRLNPSLLDHTHVWLLPQYLSPTWWELDSASIAQLPEEQRCSNSDIAAILKLMNLLVLSSVKYNIPAVQKGVDLERDAYTLDADMDVLLSRVMTKARHLSMGKEISSSLLRQSLLAAAYDSVWTLVLAYHNILSEGRNLSQADLSKEIREVAFRGMTKDHDFASSEIQDFSASVLVSQFINGSLQPVVLITNLSSCTCVSCSGTFINMTSSIRLPGFSSYASNFKWPGGVVPSDGILMINSVIPVAMLVSALLLSVLAFSLCLAMLIAMVAFRNNKHIKSTSPMFMLLAMISCMTIIPSGIVFGLTFSATEYGLSERVQEFLCIIEYPLISVGQLVAIAVFIAKSWRIYRIFYNSHQNNEVTGITTTHLNAVIAGISSLYIIILVLWLAIDRPLPRDDTIPISSSVELRLSHCYDGSTFSLWKVSLVLYSTLILILLGYLSFKNTKIKDPRFKEEGQSSARLAAAIIVSYLVLVILVLTSMDPKYHWFPRHVQMFWSLTIYANVSPVVFFSVIFIPKYARIYRDYRTKKKEIGNMAHIVELMLKERETLRLNLNKKNEQITVLKSRNSVRSVRFSTTNSQIALIQ